MKFLLKYQLVQDALKSDNTPRVYVTYHGTRYTLNAFINRHRGIYENVACTEHKSGTDFVEYLNCHVLERTSAERMFWTKYSLSPSETIFLSYSPFAYKSSNKKITIDFDNTSFFDTLCEFYSCSSNNTIFLKTKTDDLYYCSILRSHNKLVYPYNEMTSSSKKFNSFKYNEYINEFMDLVL